MFKNYTHRSLQDELMDNPNMSHQELRDAFADIEHVNSFLGGFTITIDGILALENYALTNEPLQIIDVGCGNGQTLKKCHQYALKHHKNWKLMGIDINPKTIAIAQNQFAHYPEIEFMQTDVFTEQFQDFKPHIFIFSLTLHHFNDNQIVTILQNAISQASVGIVINDLQRSRLAYGLFKLYSFLFLKSPIAIHDGKVSILRGFKKNELQAMANHLPQAKHILKPKWAFRWLWIIKKI